MVVRGREGGGREGGKGGEGREGREGGRGGKEGKEGGEGRRGGREGGKEILRNGGRNRKRKHTRLCFLLLAATKTIQK